MGDLSHSPDGILIPLQVRGSIPVWELEFFPFFPITAFSSIPYLVIPGQQLLLLFSVTPFKIDRNKNQNRSIDKVQNLGDERRYIYKDPRQDSGQRNISYTRYPKKRFTQTYGDLYGDATLVLTWMSTNMADGNQQKHLLPIILRETHKR